MAGAAQSQPPAVAAVSIPSAVSAVIMLAAMDTTTDSAVAAGRTFLAAANDAVAGVPAGATAPDIIAIPAAAAVDTSAKASVSTAHSFFVDSSTVESVSTVFHCSSSSRCLWALNTLCCCCCGSAIGVFQCSRPAPVFPADVCCCPTAAPAAEYCSTWASIARGTDTEGNLFSPPAAAASTCESAAALWQLRRQAAVTALLNAACCSRRAHGCHHQQQQQQHIPLLKASSSLCLLRAAPTSQKATANRSSSCPRC